MKVLHLISSGGLYGAEAVILNLSETLNAEGNESAIAVFAHHGSPEPELHRAALAKQLHTELLPCQGQLDLKVGKTLRELVERQGTDVLHAHGYKADIYTAIAFAGRQRPALVSTCHTWYDNDFAVRAYGALDRLVLRGFDEVIAVSKEVKERLLAASVNSDRVRLIRNGVGLDVAAGERPTKQAEPSDAEVRIGLVGRLAPEKGVDLFVNAAAILAPHIPQLHFLVAGEGPERQRLQSQIDSLGLSARVTLLGEQKSMAAFYRSLDLLVSASRQEGLPMALLEGMAQALPVVATRVGEVPEVVVHGETGLLVRPHSAEELAAAIKRLVQAPAERRSFGLAGVRHIASEFSAERMTRDYREVYLRAITRHRRSLPMMQYRSGSV